MNPRAVKTALCYGDGAKYVSFGAHSTLYQASREGRLVDGVFKPLSEIYPEFRRELETCISVPEGPPSPELDEILRLIASHPDVYMITGHVSVPEATQLVDYAEDYGIERVVVSSAVVKEADLDELMYMVDRGAYMEYTLAAYTHTTSIPKTHYYVEREYASIDEGMSGEVGGGVKAVAEQMERIGWESCVMCTDFGVYTLPTPVEGLREFIACLMDMGIPDEDISTMVKRNPEKLLGLT